MERQNINQLTLRAQQTKPGDKHISTDNLLQRRQNMRNLSFRNLRVLTQNTLRKAQTGDSSVTPIIFQNAHSAMLRKDSPTPRTPGETKTNEG